MGALSQFCPCSNNDDNYKKSTMENPQPQRKGSSTSADELFKKETTPTGLPERIADLKISTKNLIQKRLESPWNHYKKIKNLGAGAYGSVDKVESIASGIIRAMKIISKDSIAEGESIDSITNEIKLLSILDHPNIMKIYEFYEDDENLYLITEFCDKGDFTELLKEESTLPEFIVEYFMKQIFQSVAYLHSMKVIHGDIKKENILLYSKNNTKDNFMQVSRGLSQEINYELTTIDIKSKQKTSGKGGPALKKKFSMGASKFLKDLGQFEIKLIDFGCAKMFNRKKLSGIIGTTTYCSPEVLDNYYNEVSDEWSCGILMYYILAGVPPFDGETEEEVENLIKTAEPDFESGKIKKASSECKDLIKKLLIKEPEKRLKASEALKHPFFKSVTVAEEEIKENLGGLTKKKLEILRKESIKTTKFKEAVIAYISLNFVTKEEEGKIKQIFKEFSDDDSNYKITREQFIKHLRENLDTITEEDANNMFESIDNDHNGFIEYQELIRSFSDKQSLLNDKNLREAFDYFDEDKSQAISWGEIYKVITGGKTDAKKDKIMIDFLHEIGKEEDEEVNFEEFKKIVKG